MQVCKGALHNYVTPKSAVFYPPTHPVTHSNARPDTRVMIGLDPPTHLRALRNYAMSPKVSVLCEQVENFLIQKHMVNKINIIFVVISIQF